SFRKKQLFFLLVKSSLKNKKLILFFLRRPKKIFSVKLLRFLILLLHSLPFLVSGRSEKTLLILSSVFLKGIWRCHLLISKQWTGQKSIFIHGKKLLPRPGTLKGKPMHWPLEKD